MCSEDASRECVLCEPRGLSRPAGKRPQVNQQSGFRLAGLTPEQHSGETSRPPPTGHALAAGDGQGPGGPQHPQASLHLCCALKSSWSPSAGRSRVKCMCGAALASWPVSWGWGGGGGGWIHLLTAAARTAGSVSWNRAGTRRMWLQTRTFLVAPGPLLLCQGGCVSPAKQHQETGSPSAARSSLWHVGV